MTTAARQTHQEPPAFARRISERPQRGCFQPVWVVYPRIEPMGFDLLVIDDGDACKQLDVFQASLFGSSTRAPVPRSHMTIKPRGS